MKFVRSLLGAIGCTVSAIVLAGCVAAAVEAWIIRRAVTDRAADVCDRLDVGLHRAGGALDGFHRSVKTVRADLKLIDEDRDELEIGETRNPYVAAYLRTVAQRLTNFAATAAAAADILRTYRELPVTVGERVGADRVTRADARAAELATAARKLEARVGGDKPLSETELVDAAAEADRALQAGDTTVSEWQTDLEAGRADLADARSGIPRRVTLVAVAVTLVCSWVGVSQLLALRSASRWVRSRRFRTEVPLPTAPAAANR